jgi:short-subunit dehydrogenase
MRLSSACDYRRPATHEELVMTTIPYRTALIVGAGSGISGSVARGLATAGLKVGVARQPRSAWSLEVEMRP